MLTERSTLRSIIVVGVVAAIGTQAFAADIKAGKDAFSAQCTLCHSAEAGDGGGAQGPLLVNLFGRAAATADREFPYTQALKDSKLVWDAATLERFLAAPADVVPGTAMATPVPQKADRDNIVAYFESLKK